jgi:hypothetical protein
MCTMQDTSDEERKAVLGEVLADELKILLEYVREIPLIQDALDKLATKVDGIDSKLIVLSMS